MLKLFGLFNAEARREKEKLEIARIKTRLAALGTVEAHNASENLQLRQVSLYIEVPEPGYITSQPCRSTVRAWRSLERIVETAHPDLLPPKTSQLRIG